MIFCADKTYMEMYRRTEMGQYCAQIISVTQ